MSLTECTSVRLAETRETGSDTRVSESQVVRLAFLEKAK